MPHSNWPWLPAALLSGLWAGSVVWAQDNTGGMRADAELSFGILSENDDILARTDLGFALSSVTRTQQFRFFVGAGLEKSDADATIRIVSPALTADYSREGANAAFDTMASYGRSEVDTFKVEETVADSDAPTTAELLADTGFRSDARVSARLKLGTQSPIGAEFGLGLHQVRYTETESTSLNDYDIFDANAMVRFTFDPRIEGRLTARQSDLSARDGGSDRLEQSVGIGTTLNLSRVARLDLDLNYTRIETRADGGLTETDDGPTLAVAAVWDRPDGEFRFDLDSRIAEGGTRVSARVGRLQETTRGALTWSAGASQGGDGVLDATFALDYELASRRAEFGAGLRREIRADPFGAESRVDRFDIRYKRALSERGVVETALGYRQTHPLATGESNVTRMELTLGYSHQLTRDIDLLTSMSHARKQVESGDDVSETSLYLGIQSRFSWRP